jgi:hypothetical protein
MFCIGVPFELLLIGVLCCVESSCQLCAVFTGGNKEILILGIR